MLCVPTGLHPRVNGKTKSIPPKETLSKVVMKRSLETNNSSKSSAEEESSDVYQNTCTNSDAEEDVASNNNRPMNSVVVCPNPAKRIRQSTSSLQVSNIKVENKTDKVHQPDPIEGLDDLRK